MLSRKFIWTDVEARPPLTLGAKAHVVAGDRATAMATTALNMVNYHNYSTIAVGKNEGEDFSTKMKL
jgi:hypothetical protein